jgi:hypothetical protein
MPGDAFGFSCSVEVIVQSGPFDPESPTNPRELADAIEAALGSLRFTTRSGGEHTVAEVNVYRVAPTYTSLRKQFGLSTPWADEPHEEDRKTR